VSFLTRRKAKARILALDNLIEAQTEARNKLINERQYIRDTGRLDWHLTQVPAIGPKGPAGA